ncbi:hypothetical protein ACLKA7_011621 [Drosophila subpalustris]
MDDFDNSDDDLGPENSKPAATPRRQQQHYEQHATFVKATKTPKYKCVYVCITTASTSTTTPSSSIDADAMQTWPAALAAAAKTRILSSVATRRSRFLG